MPFKFVYNDCSGARHTFCGNGLADRLVIITRPVDAGTTLSAPKLGLPAHILKGR